MAISILWVSSLPSSSYVSWQPKNPLDRWQASVQKWSGITYRVDRVRRKVSEDRIASEATKLFIVIRLCHHMWKVRYSHDMGMMLIISRYYVSVYGGCFIIFFWPNRSSSSLATLLQCHVSPTRSTQKSGLKAVLTSHLVREHQCNTSHTNTGSCVVIEPFCWTGYRRSTRGSMRLLSLYFAEEFIQPHAPQPCSPVRLVPRGP